MMMPDTIIIYLDFDLLCSHSFTEKQWAHQNNNDPSLHILTDGIYTELLAFTVYLAVTIITFAKYLLSVDFNF